MNLAPKQEAPGLAQARRTPLSKPKSRGFNRNNIMNKQEKELADNFAKSILNARESKGWTQAQLGQRMAETVNIIKSAESGKPPSDSVVKKFEMILGIELMVEASSDHQSMIGQSSNSRGMTIGDYLKDLR
jgi:ribosome-binding protein aMBF1 (putative translation factor)